jgi:superfamily I DNA/RNA helicase
MIEFPENILTFQDNPLGHTIDHYLSVHQPESDEEESRMVYMGVMRAKHVLHLSTYFRAPNR